MFVYVLQALLHFKLTFLLIFFELLKCQINARRGRRYINRWKL